MKYLLANVTCTYQLYIVGSQTPVPTNYTPWEVRLPYLSTTHCGKTDSCIHQLHTIRSDSCTHQLHTVERQTPVHTDYTPWEVRLLYIPTTHHQVRLSAI